MLTIEPSKKPIIEASSRSQRFVQAGPGTGKTFCLIERIRFLVEEECLRPGTEILILSFSVAAVTEVRERLTELSSESGEGSDLPLVEIRTFDSFATRLLVKLGEEESLKDKAYDERIEIAIDALVNNEAVKDHLGDVQHLMVDEVQDLVGARARMTLELLTQIGGGRAGFTLFGDLAQGIFDFQLEGKKEDLTSLEFLQGVRDRFSALDEDVRLGKNFRVAGQSKLERLAQEGRDRILDDVGSGAEYLFEEFDKLESFGELSNPESFPSPISVLCRDNGQVLRLASTLRNRHQSVYITPKKDSRYLPPWVALILMGLEGRLLRKSEFKKRYQDNFRSWFPEIEKCWIALYKFGRDRNSRNKLDLIRLRQALVDNASFERDLNQLEGDVHLSTIHRSKGREYDDVVVVMSDGVRPEEAIDSDAAVVDEDVEGETKVLFVALTRARKNLFRMDEGGRDGLRLAPPKKERWLEMPFRSGQFGTYNQFKSIEVGLLDDLDIHSFASVSIHTDLEGVKNNQRLLEGLSRGTAVSLKFSRLSGGLPIFSVLIDGEDELTIVGETSQRFGRDFRSCVLSEGGRLKKFPHHISGLWVSEVVTEIGESGRPDIPRSLSSFPVWLGIRLQGLGRCEEWQS